jgi:P-type Cu2+ transporter
MIKLAVKAFPVTGMSCTSCALNVERTLGRQPGVLRATVNYANSTALVEVNPSLTNDNQLQSAVRAIGYDLLIEPEDSSGKEKTIQDHNIVLRNNMTGALLLSIPIMVLSMFFMHLPYLNLILLLLTIPVVTWFGRNFFINAFKLARHGQANMDTLVTLSTGIAFLFSLFNTLNPGFWIKRGMHPHVYYEAASVIIAFILIGKVLEERAKSKTSSAIKNLMGLQPDTATILDNEGKEKSVPVSTIKHNDHVLVCPGDRIPVDGEIISGNSSLDESSITGESVPADKSKGYHVYAGTINLNGSFVLQAQQVGSQTVLSKIILMVQKAQGSKAPVQKTVDKVAGIFVPVVMLIAVISFLSWILFAGHNALTHALMALVTVLVIACPCALGLATPTAIMVAMGKGAKDGILIKDSESLELIHKVNAIILDKTGTLTEGRPVVTNLQWVSHNHLRNELYPILYTMEMQSAHPLARAIALSVGENSKLVQTDAYENINGKGIRARYRETVYLAGNAKLMADEGPEIKPEEWNIIQQLEDDGKTVVMFATKKELLAVIALADGLKPTSAEAVSQLHHKGVEVYMLTGDNARTAKAIAHEAGITSYRANLMPSEKAEFISELQQSGKIVAMVGDGINDSQAMAQANVSIAMGKGSDIAMDVAGMTIISSDLLKIPKAIRLSKLTVRTIYQNLFWAFIYNIIGIPVAAGVLYPLWGFMLNPMIAAAAMALSSVSVVSNSLRLRRIN